MKSVLNQKDVRRKVAAVIVTYNRKELLGECIEAIFKQTYAVNKIILINNASTDGTEELLKERKYLENKKIEYVLMAKNIGGAGGFYEGIKLAEKMNIDWIWIMDDDTIPECRCLEELLKAEEYIQNYRNEKISFLASSIYGPEGECMNVPELSSKLAANGYQYWYKFLSKGIVNISTATFVSILINKDAVKKCGLPCKEYFIWGDDSEYTKRLTTYFEEAYLVGNSIAIHKRINAKALSIKNEDKLSRIDMYHYYYRNNFINTMYYSGRYRAYMMLIKCVVECLKLNDTKLERYKRKIMCKGYREGITQYRKFASYINAQLADKDK